MKRTYLSLLLLCFLNTTCAFGDAGKHETPTLCEMHVERAGVEPEKLQELHRSRRLAKYRQRRIIMNNDGGDFSIQSAVDLNPPGKFLERRTMGLLDSQVDSIFYCTGNCYMFTNPMTEGEFLLLAPATGKIGEIIKQRQIDPLKIIIDFCRRHGKEIFWSLRFNDIHDSNSKYPALMSQWKREHPDYLVCGRDDAGKMPYGGGAWSAVNYGLPEVRDKTYRIISEVCRRYDLDGIEIDFFRHLIVFREQVWGEPVTANHCDQLTEWVQRLRRMTEQEGLRRGRPILIAVRVPDSIGYCRAIGIDLERWLTDDLIDMVTGAGDFKLEPWENLVALGKKYDVPVYACLVRQRIYQHTNPKKPDALKIWRGEAYRAWKAGVSGIYTFNFFDSASPVFREIGDPALLKTLERTDQSTYLGVPASCRPDAYVKDGMSYLKDGFANPSDTPDP